MTTVYCPPEVLRRDSEVPPMIDDARPGLLDIAQSYAVRKTKRVPQRIVNLPLS